MAAVDADVIAKYRDMKLGLVNSNYTVKLDLVL